MAAKNRPLLFRIGHNEDQGLAVVLGHVPCARIGPGEKEPPAKICLAKAKLRVKLTLATDAGIKANF